MPDIGSRMILHPIWNHEKRACMLGGTSRFVAIILPTCKFQKLCIEHSNILFHHESHGCWLRLIPYSNLAA